MALVPSQTPTFGSLIGNVFGVAKSIGFETFVDKDIANLQQKSGELKRQALIVQSELRTNVAKMGYINTPSNDANVDNLRAQGEKVFGLLTNARVLADSAISEGNAINTLAASGKVSASKTALFEGKVKLAQTAYSQAMNLSNAWLSTERQMAARNTSAATPKVIFGSAASVVKEAAQKAAGFAVATGKAAESAIVTTGKAVTSAEGLGKWLPYIGIAVGALYLLGPRFLKNPRRRR